MAIETHLAKGQFMIGEDFTWRVVMDEALTGKSVQLVVRKEPEDAGAEFSVGMAGISFEDTEDGVDLAADIAIVGTVTAPMSEGEYHWAVRRTDAGQRRSLAFGTLVATRSAGEA